MAPKQPALRHERGWWGAFTRNEAEGAWPNGSQVEKISHEPNDATPLGTLGTVLGSLHFPDAGYGYFIEWDDKPKTAIFVIDWKLRRVLHG